jgi:hypothetical protein
MKNHTVKTEQRLEVKLLILYPNPNMGKSYMDTNRVYTITVDGGEEMMPIQGQEQSFKLRSLIVIQKKYRDKVDATFTYRVGENFAELQITKYQKMRIAIDFSDGNVLKVLDDSSHIRTSNILS